MKSYVQRLQDPQLVARFQRRCGLCLKVVQSIGRCSNYQHGNWVGRQESLDPMDEEPVSIPEQYVNGNGRHLLNRSLQHNGKQKKGEAVEKEKPQYIVKNYFFYYLFRFAAALGQEIFYITFLPFTYWNFDPFVTRRLISIWAIVMYIGQASKDILKWPRPSSPPVVKLETRVDAEYGMPSTHAMAATAISFTFLISTMYRYEYSFVLGLLTAIIMSTLVSLSRIYTGMHTVLDIICGVLITGVIMTITFPFWNTLDNLQLTSSLTPIIAMVLPFTLSYTYPALDHYSPTRGDTTIILGVAAGSTVGCWLNYQYGKTYEPVGSLPFEIPSVNLDTMFPAVTRFLTGVCILFLTRQVIKTLSLKALCAWFDIPKLDTEARQRLEIEVPYKFVTYSSLGFIGIAVVPLLFQYLGLL